MGYGNKIFATISLFTASVALGTITPSIAQSIPQEPLLHLAQYSTVYGPNHQPYHVDENARRNNELHGLEERRNRQIRRQIRRKNRARQRARNRAKRQRLYEVQQRERQRANGGYVQKYDYYGNPIPTRLIQPNQRNRIIKRLVKPKTRARVKLVYVPIPRDKPYYQVAQKPANKVIKTATAPKTGTNPPILIKPRKTIKPSEIAALPKIQIETIPNPSSTPTPSVKQIEPKKPVAKAPIKSTPKPEPKKAELPKVFKPTKSVEAPKEKIKYTTFAETLRKIRERNKVEKQKQIALSNAPATKLPAPELAKPIVPSAKVPEVKKPVVKVPNNQPPKVEKIAALEPKKQPKPKFVPPSPATNQISCKKAREIIADYGFSDVTKITCQGKDYNFNAKRDGKPFKITLSALSGELTKVLRQK